MSYAKYQKFSLTRVVGKCLLPTLKLLLYMVYSLTKHIEIFSFLSFWSYVIISTMIYLEVSLEYSQFPTTHINKRSWYFTYNYDTPEI